MERRETGKGGERLTLWSPSSSVHGSLPPPHTHTPPPPQIIAGYTKHAEELVTSLRQEAKKQTDELIEIWESESKRRRGTAPGRSSGDAAGGGGAAAPAAEAAGGVATAAKSNGSAAGGGSSSGGSGVGASSATAADGEAKAKDATSTAGAVPSMDATNELAALPTTAVPGSLADPFDLVLRVTTGVYEGRVFRLKPRYRRAARWIGRSTGRKFKVHGMSLSEDSEVSTTHGRVDCMAVDDGPAGVKVHGIFITDMGSTNGTKINGEMIEEAIAVRLHSGDELIVGSNTMTVAVVPSSSVAEAGAAATKEHERESVEGEA